MSNIEKRMEDLKISRMQLCKAIGICPKTYYLYIKKHKPIPSDKLINMSRVLRCSVDYLLGIKNYTHITVSDKEGAVLADISQNEIIEQKDVKVVLS